MKRLLFTLLLVWLTLPGFAQKFSPQEYKLRFESYITEKAGLTKEEASKFFPLYQEMKDKQRVSFHEIRRITHRTVIENTDEESFRNLNDRVCELNMQINKVEKEYLDKFRKIISNKKFFLVKKAEADFQYRELRERDHRVRK